MIRSLTIILFFTPIALLQVNAQVLSAGIPKGGGSFSDCDSSMVVDFTVEPIGDLEQLFTASIQPGNNSVLGTTWTYYTNEIQQQSSTSISVTFPAPGEAPVCLTVSAIDQGTLEACNSTTCRFVDILQDPSCAIFQPDFTIGSIAGSTIVFEETAPMDSTTYLWTFGDGTAPASASPEYTFDGPGPHKVCLTITGPSPINCTATICKWLYLGPGDVACEQLVSPGFLHFQDGNFVVVLDTSIVTGQSSSIHWDFGDGTTAEGAVAVHEYEDGWNQYDLCAQIDVWGPLVADTCHVQNCQLVELGGSIAAIEEEALFDLRIAPNPANDRITVIGQRPLGTYFEILDVLGRSVLKGNFPALDGSITIDIGSLGRGMHFLRCESDGKSALLRFVKM